MELPQARDGAAAEIRKNTYKKPYEGQNVRLCVPAVRDTIDASIDGGSFMERKNAWKNYDEQALTALEALSCRYKAVLDQG